MNRSVKTHMGARALFHQLVREGMTFPRDLFDFLDDGFRLKTDADYGSRKLADAHAARAAVETAEAFVARCRDIVRGA